jgi:hypothetical protein
MAIKTISELWRDYQVAGLPSSGPHEPVKSDIRATLTNMQDLILAAAATTAVIFSTRAGLLATLTYAANTRAEVRSDPTEAFNGIYVKSGNSGSGTWTRVSDLPDSVVRLSVTGGSANAIQASASPQLPVTKANKIYILTPTATNTNAVTLQVDSDAATDLLSAFGSPLAANSILVDVPYLLVYSDGDYRLLLPVDVDASSILAAAVQAKEDAEDFSEVAEAHAADAAASAATALTASYATKAAVAAATISAALKHLRTAGYATVGDGGGALWHRLQDAPSPVETWHVRSVDRVRLDGTTDSTHGGYWTHVESVVKPQQMGAIGSGLVDDTTAVQDAEDRRAQIDGQLLFPPGTYAVSGIVVDRAQGGEWRGHNAKLIPTTNNMTMVTLDNAVTSASGARNFTIDGMSFFGAGQSDIVAVREADTYLTTLTNCTFNNVAYAGIFERGRGINISNITQYGSGSWLFTGVGTGGPDRIFEVNISNVSHQSLGSTDWTDAPQWFSFYRCVGAQLTNVITASLDGAAIGIEITGACEGIFLNNVIIVYPTTGINMAAGADSIRPTYVYLTNVGLDQPTVSGWLVDGEAIRASNVNVTFGDLRTNSGPGVRIENTAIDVRFNGMRISNMYRDGLEVETGALDVGITNLRATDNNQVAGAYVDVNLDGSTFANVRLYGKNKIGTEFSSGQTIDANGESQP